MTEDNNKKLPIATVDRFLDIQDKELTLREKELEHSKQARELDHEYALKALDAQIKDREGIRQHESSNTKFRYAFAAAILIGLFFLFGVAIRYNKDQIVMEILKVIMYVGAGALGGYSWGVKGKKSINADNE
ncbi:hypothetical protein [Legionella drancourtii]|uniref:Uncharacterized protein n=1 Tax=Legionella drancourtii LLAP12 TaxID=658187 RepID=G9EIY8_9GAMM|nr:hypothetical protein [Legionella drancourtii]EHL32751.1 hypothetical protein LDG_5145 [Legionella drancourtii LLAP12]